MEQPRGFENKEFPNHVCKLDRALYGMKQASRVWFTMVTEVLKNFNMEQHLLHEKCAFYRIDDDGNWLVVLVFVDDIIYHGDESLRKQFVEHLKKAWTIKDLGEVERYIGINIIRNDDGTIDLEQHEDVMKMLEKFNMAKCNPIACPGDMSEIGDKRPDDVEMSSSIFRSAIGSLFWIALATRPDILSAVTICSQHQSSPNQRVWAAVKRIFRYLRGTSDKKLRIDVGEDFTLTTYSDASQGDKALKRFSMSGAIHFLGNAPVFWSARKQKTPALSSAAAELVAASSAIRDALWLRHLLAPFGFTESIPLFIDNNAVISIGESQGMIRRIKHLEVHDMFLRVVVERGDVTLIYVPTQYNLADILTKSIRAPVVFRYLRDAIMAGLRGRDKT
jgi:hypothetical protein